MPTDDPDRTRERDPDATFVRPSDAPSPAAEVGVPGYEIVGTLGRGGMGVVYKATQAGLNRVVALKMLLAGPFADPALRARFLLEAESVAALEHPHIVKVFAFGEHAGHPYLAMEYVPGGSLAERIKSNGPLPAAEAASLLTELADAVAHAHSRGVVHRDIKPLNVLLTSDGEPRLTDFGLAKVGRADQHLSVTGQVLGTPAYMSPEQAAGKVREVGTAADVYALGAVLYDLLTGRPPFAGDSMAVTLQKVLTEEPVRPRKHNPLIPRDLELICLKCLEKEPAKRYATAEALANDLRRYVRNEPISVRPAGAVERGYKWVKRNKVIAGAMAAVSLTLVVGAGVSLGFGLEAKRQKEEAVGAGEREKGEAARADRERDAAIAAKNDLERKNAELAEAQQRTSRTLAKALLGPITADGRDKPLTAYEMEALWQIAELRRTDVARMFLEEAARSPLTCRQFACRMEYAHHAAVGLDLLGRDATDGLLRSRLNGAVRGESTRALALAISRSSYVTRQTAVDAAIVLGAAISHEKKADELVELAEALAAVAERMGHTEAARFRTETERPLAAELKRVTPPGSFADLFLDGRMESAVKRMIAAARGEGSTEVVRPSGIRPLADAIQLARGKQASGFGDLFLSDELDKAAKHIEDAEAAGTYAETARLLTAALSREDHSRVRIYLAEGLAAAVARMTPDEAAGACAEAVRALIVGHARSIPLRENDDWSRGLVTIAGRIPPSARERSLRATSVAPGAFAMPHNLLPSLPLLHPHFHPQPRPLPPQELVELLKHPFCVGGTRRAVLDALQFTYNRPFKDLWEFVEFAEKHHPELDLLTPPKRPEPKP